MFDVSAKVVLPRLFECLGWNSAPVEGERSVDQRSLVNWWLVWDERNMEGADSFLFICQGSENHVKAVWVCDPMCLRCRCLALD